MSNTVKMLVIAIVAIITLQGCAMIMNGSTQRIMINSTPNEATVSVYGTELLSQGTIDYQFLNANKLITTPTTIKVPRSASNIIVRIEKEGYEPTEIMLIRTVSGWIVGNFWSWGLLGFAIDFTSGGAFDIQPSYIRVNLRELHSNIILDIQDVN